jgi:hypothetical protein
MLAARISVPNFSVSATTKFPKSAGEPGNAVPPRSASRLEGESGQASVGIAGVGAAGHLAGILFQRETGTPFFSCPIAATDQLPRIWLPGKSIS